MDNDATTTATTRRDCDPSTSYAFSGKLMLISVLILLIVCLVILFFHMYARWFFFRRSRSHQRLRLHRRPRRFSSDLTQATAQGLDLSVLKSLPIFHYSSTTNSSPLECAVCLSEFEENEKGRLLPKCNHSFHLDCIDIWFHSHSNCPLCRSPVPPPIHEIRLPVTTAAVTEPAGSIGGSDEPVGSAVVNPVQERNEDAIVMIDVDPASDTGTGFKPGAGNVTVGSLKRYLSI